MKLVIVESPTKAKTISQFLGKDFTVESSMGHIRDLPRSKLGIDVEKNFEPAYVIPTKARKRVNELKRESVAADTVILATDEDREGEAIAWHLVQALGLNETKNKPSSRAQVEGKSKTKNIERIVFHEITKRAIAEALEHPRSIDANLVNAQQARRILDRLVGYELSPFLWKKVFRGLSAGRVQSVALRLIVEREREIEKFKAKEYWTIEALLAKNGTEFRATLKQIGEERLDKFAIDNETRANSIVSSVQGRPLTVTKVEEKSVSRKPLPPFITSTLQQEGSRRFRFSAKQTMRLAQMLYEEGYITYMRTDSVHVSKESTAAAEKTIEALFGSRYAGSAPRIYTTKSKLAQEAHEAIRPTDPNKTPDELKTTLDAQQLKLYTLIWQRFIASQMPNAEFRAVAAEFSANGADDLLYILSANGSTISFDGFMKAWPTETVENDLPQLEEKELLVPTRIEPLQHFTQPPPRYSEAALIKTLEENGIGRPSTYAPTLSVIQNRNYVEKDEGRKFRPTEIGIIVNDMLVSHFPVVVDINFTAKMEEELDEIAEGKIRWQPVIKDFYGPFKENLNRKYDEVEKHEFPEETTDEVCDKCGKPMTIKRGRFGKFLACSGFPDCKSTKTIKAEPKKIGMKCLQCAEGEMVERRTRKRKLFYGCSRWPECSYASWKRPSAEQAPDQQSTPEDEAPRA